VLVPGGRLGFTVWGHIKKSPGAWSLSPFQLASQPGQHGGVGRPGAGEELLSRYGFEDVSRMTVPFAWEFPDPDLRASTGVHRSGVGSDPDGGPGGVRPLGHRDGARARPGRPAAADLRQRGRRGPRLRDGFRDAGYDPQILAITLFIALRIAFSTVNGALGTLPDGELHDAVPPHVREVVTWGRPAGE
jgi:hypothetical protein